MAQADIFDVLVAGGGPVGQTLALALARQDLSVALLDGRDPGAPSTPEPRAYLIAAGCWRMFEALGVAARMQRDAEPVLRVENRAGGGAIGFGLDDAAEDSALGYMIEAGRLGAGLAAAVSAERRISMLAPRRLVLARFEDLHAVVETDQGQVRAHLAAACDGARSVLRGAAGIRFEGRDYPLKAVSAFVDLPGPHEGAARQTFVSEGPLAVLPMTGQRANLVWSVPGPLADTLAAMPAADFEAELDRAGEGFVRGLKLASARATFPLGLRLADPFHGHRVALLGDAAHLVHPLAGQGLNLGLKDAAALSDVVAEALRLGLDIGSAAQLEGYTQWRRPDAVATAAAMDAFVRAFRGPRAVRALAGLAMETAGQIGPVRRWFARTAVGSAGDAPSLMRPRDPFGSEHTK